MGIERTSASPEELLAEVEWVRRVARALVGRGESDEVVQQTYLQALSTPPAPGPLRRWLGTVVRNVIRRNARDVATRARHEVHAPEVTRTPDPGETVARAELHRRVVEAVLALDEPYRSTLLLRFFEDQSAEAIARAQSIPIETVRTRVKRGIAQLRTKLESAAGGDGEAGVAARALLVVQLRDLAWRNAAVSVAAGAAGAAALTTGGVMMSIAMKSSIAAAVVAVVGLSVWLVRGRDPRRFDVGAATARAPQAAADAVDLPPPQIASRAVEAVATASEKDAKGDDAATTSAPPPDCSVRGVVTDVADRPAAGVKVMALIASRWAPPSLESLASIAKQPGGTTDEISGATGKSRAAAMTTTDGDGRFTLAGLSDEDAWIVGAVDDEGACATSDKFRFEAKQRSVERDLKLVPLVELKGRVVDADGMPIGAARTRVDFIWDGQRKASQHFMTAFAGRDAGTWSTGRHPAEAFEVEAESPGFVKSKQRLRVDVLPGRHEADVVIVLEAKSGVLTSGPIVDESGQPFDLEKRLTKLLGNPLPDDHEPWMFQVAAVDETSPTPELGGRLDGARESGRILFNEGSYEFRLPENFRGWLALTIDHRVVGAARLDSPAAPPPLPFVAPPSMVPPETALVIVTVVDGTTGAAIDARRAGIFVDDAWMLTSNPARRAPSSVPVPEGAVAFIAPLERVKVRATRQGFVSSCPELELTKAGERREVTVTLSPADCGIRGRALNHDSSPIVDVDVDVYRATGHGLEGVPIEPAHTNGDGSFHVHGLAAGAYTVVVSHGKDAAAIAQATAASPPPTIELRSPQGQHTDFRVLAPPAPDGRTNLMVRIVNDSGIPVYDEFGAYLQTTHQSETFGATLAPGRYRVFVWFHGCREGSVEFDVPPAGTVEIPVERIETRR